MKLTVYFDGSFWVGVIENVQNGQFRVYRWVFGPEPGVQEIWHFVLIKLPRLIECSTSGTKAESPEIKRINPKRLQRMIAKEEKQAGIGTKAQEVLRKAFEARKQAKRKWKKERISAYKDRQYQIRKEKSKQKHRGR